MVCEVCIYDAYETHDKENDAYYGVQSVQKFIAMKLAWNSTMRLAQWSLNYHLSAPTSARDAGAYAGREHGRCADSDGHIPCGLHINLCAYAKDDSACGATVNATIEEKRTAPAGPEQHLNTRKTTWGFSQSPIVSAAPKKAAPFARRKMRFYSCGMQRRECVHCGERRGGFLGQNLRGS